MYASLHTYVRIVLVVSNIAKKPFCFWQLSALCLTSISIMLCLPFLYWYLLCFYFGQNLNEQVDNSEHWHKYNNKKKLNEVRNAQKMTIALLLSLAILKVWVQLEMLYTGAIINCVKGSVRVKPNYHKILGNF